MQARKLPALLQAWTFLFATFFLGQTGHAETFVADCLGKGSVALEGDWQFHFGDNPAWAQPNINDTAGQDGWELIRADAPWGAQSHPNHPGYAWYRRHIHMTPAPATSSDLALIVPAIDDVYEIYWNGVRVGGLGRFPPHLRFLFVVPAQTYGLGPMRDGVLAVRVLKLPFASVDDGTAGGFEAAPSIGGPEAIAKLKDSLDYGWMRSSQFRFGLSWLYVLTSFLSFLAWMRDRKQPLLLWLAAYTLMPFVELLLTGLRLPGSGAVLTVAVQTAIQIREVTQWFLLAYLLQLNDSARLMRFLRITAWVSIVAGALDGGLILFLLQVPDAFLAWADALLTLIILPVEILPAFLVFLAIYQRRRLDLPRWLVAVFACASATWYATSNFLDQGTRYTHWTLGQRMNNPVISLFGSSIPTQGILRTLLFASLVYAVVRYAGEYRRRQVMIEQEYQNARELQQILVPENLPSIPGFRLTSSYRPAQEVGGDFFQVIPLQGDHAGSTMILLGDVSGKGLKAAMTVSLIVGAARTLVETTAGPAMILAGLNRRLHGRLEGGFATCVALRLEADGGCIVATAGHPSPVLNHQELPLPGALPLGILADSNYSESLYQLKPGDHLALYTDGLLEARNASGELYGFERLHILFGGQASAEQASAAAVAFGQDDDVTVLTLTCLGAAVVA